MGESMLVLRQRMQDWVVGDTEIFAEEVKQGLVFRHVVGSARLIVWTMKEERGW